VFLFFGIIVNAENSTTSLIISSPGSDASKEINISWHTDNNDNFVRYTLASDQNFTEARTKVGECTPIPFNDKSGTLHCKATLTNLQDDTEYIYQVGKTSWSSTRTFKTAGSSSFSFVHVSDIHSYLPGSRNYRVARANALLNKAYSIENDLRFTLISGDAVAYGTVYEQWLDLFAMDTTTQMMYTLTPGNHDYYNTKAEKTNIGYFNSVTNHPNNGANGLNNATYYFKYGNALFISLESEAANASASAQKAQQTWLKEIIALNPADFVIAFCHRPFYTGDGRNAGQAQEQRNYFQTIFDECGVDLVLTGHNHVLARTFPVYNNNKTNTPNGTVYITASAVGDRWQTEEGTSMPMVDYYKIGAFDSCTIVTVEENSIKLKMVDASGAVLDTYQIFNKTTGINKSSYNDSLNIVSNDEDFSQAVLEFKDLGPGRINKITVTSEDGQLNQTFLFPTAPLTITGIPDNVIEYQLTVETLLRSGETIKKNINLINQHKYFGKIQNLRILEIDDYQTGLFWDSELVEGKILMFEIYINGIFHKNITPEEDFTVLDQISPYKQNEVEFRAIDFEDEIVFSEKIVYGEDADPVNLNFNKEIHELNVGAIFTPEITISPEQNLLLEFTSSNEAVATVDKNGKITAVGPGNCTITVSVIKRWDVTDTIEIVVNIPEEPLDPNKTEKKKGCFGIKSATFLFSLGALLILLRKNKFL